MKRINIFAWYYEHGLHGLLELIKNHLAFAWRYFSVSELFITLLHPWHRDVTMHTWRGWNPAKSLEVFVTNIMSRLIGAFVRFLVIATGIFATVGLLVLGMGLILLWIAFPLLLISLPLLPFLYASLFLPSAIAGIVFLIAIFWTYRSDTNFPLAQKGLAQLVTHPVFKRICGRLGVGQEDFPAEILESQELLGEFLKKLDITLEEFQTIIHQEVNRWQCLEDDGKFWRKENLDKIQAIGLQWRFGYTVHLDQYANEISKYDFSEYAQSGLIGRQEQLQVAKLILERPDQNCLLLVGQAGIGKKTLIHTLARQIRKRELRGYFSNKRVLLLDLGRVISDVMNRGEDVENFLRLLFMEAAYAGNVILVIEHLEHYFGKEVNTFHPDISSVLSEFLGIPTLQIIATSTPHEYHALIEKQESISKYFEVVEFSEPSDIETLQILFDKLEVYESSRVVFSYQALRSIISSAERYNWEFPMPERALDLAMEVLTYWEKQGETMFVTAELVGSYLELKTGIPQGEIGAVERKKLLNLEEMLHRHVIGQEEAVEQVAKALRRMRSGVGNTGKPIGSFLFLGPTGVGKTETAKALARAYFGDEKHMIRLDMSEFQSPNSLDRLIGNVALGQQGQLVTKAKDNPYTLLLLDEIEKAYPAVLDLFLQVLDEGFMTDAFGEKINFRNMIIIATSNAGAPLIKRLVEEGQQDEEIKQHLIDHVIEEGVFRVEFLNRFESVVFFRPLNSSELSSVARLILKKLTRRLNKEKNIEVTFGESVVDMIIREGYNPIFGARSLNRFVDSAVEDLIAKKIIAGEVQRGEKIAIEL